MNVDEVFGETSCRTSAKMSAFKRSQILSQRPESRTSRHVVESGLHVPAQVPAGLPRGSPGQG